MLRDVRYIADLYVENTMTTQIGQSQMPTTASPASADGAAAGLTPAAKGAVALGQANEERKLPSKHWVKIEKIIKDDVREIDNVAHEIATLIHTCCDNTGVVSKVMSKVLKKHRQWSKK
jgi:hypothetical protein